MVNINVKVIHENAIIPEYKTSGASGMDLSSVIEYVLKPKEVKAIPTGLIMKIPPGLEGQVRPRSGLALKYGITVLNTPGTIDSDYVGEIKVILINHSNEDYIIKVGDRIAQLVICPVVQVDLHKVEDILQTERGAGGFGSTGV